MSVIEQTLENVDVELEVQLGSTKMPVHQLLRMGRGAIIELDATENDDLIILANDVPIARAAVQVTAGKIAVAITKMLRRPKKLTSAWVMDDDHHAAEAAPQS